MARDEIRESQRRVLLQRSGGVCAYPGCGIPLVIDSDAPADELKAVGEAAHIAAASEGGPRYDENMTSQQRGSADNFIYLCLGHHAAVDSQLDKHTVEWLRAVPPPRWRGRALLDVHTRFRLQEDRLCHASMASDNPEIAFDPPACRLGFLERQADPCGYERVQVR